MTTDITTHAIRVITLMMETRLCEACELASDAVGALETGARNQAIGTLLPLETELATITALFNAVLALHRMSPGQLSFNKGDTTCQ